MILLGHRGAPYAAPENTLESFRQALRMGARGFEFDVRASGDGRLVVVHDPRAWGRRVASTPAALLGRPLLEDVLREFQGAWLDIELKVAGIEKMVVELTARYLKPELYVVTSFHAPAVREVKRLSPGTPVGLLFKRPVLRLPAWARKPELDFLAPHHTVLSRRLSLAARERGLRLIAWTVNTPAAMRRMREREVDVVITDYPDRFR